MVVKKIKRPACILCPRNQPSLCGECFLAITEKPIGQVDFMNLFLEKPITIFKEKDLLIKLEIGKYY